MNNLIKKIAPLYNQYKQSKSLLDGKDEMLIMWEIGALIKQYVDQNNIAPHKLYRKVYGKSEGKENILQKSYISREFLGRCYRIHNIFSLKNDILFQLPSLKKFTNFREAMPFFDNPIYKLDGKEFADLLILLNSNKKSEEIVKTLAEKKKSINNISNSRTQKIHQLELEKESFINFYNYIFRLKGNETYAKAIECIGIKDTNTFNLISKNISALAQEGVLKYYLPEIEIKDQTFNQFYKILKELLTYNDEKIRRRFRRLIPPERIIKLADMIYSFTSENQYLK
ncbi:MAG: hypothetical protein WCJ19_05255 [bacterium]